MGCSPGLDAIIFSVANGDGFLSSGEELGGDFIQGVLVVAPGTLLDGWGALLAQGARVVASGRPAEG